MKLSRLPSCWLGQCAKIHKISRSFVRSTSINRDNTDKIIESEKIGLGEKREIKKKKRTTETGKEEIELPIKRMYFQSFDIFTQQHLVLQRMFLPLFIVVTFSIPCSLLSLILLLVVVVVLFFQLCHKTSNPSNDEHVRIS